MARTSGVVRQMDIRNLSVDAQNTYFVKLRQQCQDLYGPGELTTFNEQNGDVSWTYDYIEGNKPAVVAGVEEDLPPCVTADALTEDEIEAIRHGRILLCNAGNVRHNADTGLYEPTIDPKDDPAIVKRVQSINTLETLLARVGKASVTS